MASDVRKFRERFKTQAKFEMRKEGCQVRIDRVRDDDGREGLDDREAQEEEFGSRKAVHKHDSCQRSEQEIIEHFLTHLPCQSWCGYCMKG